MIVNASKLWPSPAEDPVNHWGELVGRVAGMGFNPLERAVLFCLRGLKLGDNETHEVIARPAYDDTFALLQAGKAPYVFSGASHPYQRDSKLSPDVTGDGRGDVGCIRARRYMGGNQWTGGVYTLRLALETPHPIFTLTTSSGSERVPVIRDTDHDGRYSEAEDRASAERRGKPQTNDDGDYATAVLFHTGFDAPANAAHRSSIACQTCSLPHLEHLASVARTMTYYVVNGWELANVLDGSGDSDAPPPPENVA